MEQLKYQLITLSIGLGLLAFNWFIDFIAGMLKATKVKKEKFSFKRMATDFGKAIIFGLTTIMLATDYYLLVWFTNRCGLDISEFGDVLSTTTIAIMLIWKSAQYSINATANYKAFINYKDEAKELADKANIDYKQIYEDFSQAIKVDDNDNLIEE